MSSIKTALIQFNPTVGALAENATRIIHLASSAAADGAQLIVFPELALCGYPPEDLILRPHFIEDCAKQLDRLAAELPKEAFCVVGAPVERFNAAVVFHGGKQIGIYRKMLLPNYGVFDEKRVFEEGNEPFTFDAFGKTVGIHICEDSWLANGAACKALAAEKPALVVNLSASPYHRGKRLEREAVFAAAAQAMGAPLLFCNQVGGQDELVFDGGSMIFDKQGRVAARAGLFTEQILIGQTGVSAPPVEQTLLSAHPLEEVYEALKTGLRDYVEKNGFKKTVVAVSGGIDSALVLAVAVDALGPDRVAAVTMPSQYSSNETLSDAEQIAANFGVELHTIPIFPLFGKMTEELSSHWNPEPGLAEENLQARIRGTLIMALSNKNGWLVLSTGNKSEYATGYCTLYGDMA
ncbi:MAG TPA: NAD+ synthase, partial [Tichowtungia sp.]|nr:NAD+ synthase [Tichowtungia sp.]